MTWSQILTLSGLMATIMAGGVALASMYNGRHVRKSVGRVEEILKGQGEILKEHGEILARMDQTLLRLGEIMEKIDVRAEERHREVLTLLTK